MNENQTKTKMKKEFDLKIDGGTLESIKIDSSNSLIIATYSRDVAEFKAGDILVDDLGPASNGCISIFKCISEEDDNSFDIYAAFDAEYNDIINIGEPGDEWDFIDDQRLATEQEKQLLFNALKKEGLRWNAEKLEVEELDISEIVFDYEIDEENSTFQKIVFKKIEKKFPTKLEEIDRPWYIDSFGCIVDGSDRCTQTPNHFTSKESAEQVLKLLAFKESAEQALEFIKLLAFRDAIWAIEGKPENEKIHISFRFKTNEGAKHFEKIKKEIDSGSL